MTEVTRLTKSAILQGKQNVNYIMFEELGGELPLRPLTDGQFNQVEVMKMGGIKVKGQPKRKPTDFKKKGQQDVEVDMDGMNMELDLEAIQKQDFEADALAVSFAIADGEHWTPDDVKQLRPPGIVKKIAQAVYELSGATPQGAEDIKSFRTK